MLNINSFEGIFKYWYLKKQTTISLEVADSQRTRAFENVVRIGLKASLFKYPNTLTLQFVHIRFSYEFHHSGRHFQYLVSKS